MTISFAGVGITPPNDADAIVLRWFHEYRIEEFEHQGYFVPQVQHLPTPYFPQRECPRIGVLRWPNGADRWATFHCCATGEQVAALRDAIGTDPTAQTLILDDGDGGVVTTDMYLLPPRPISQRGENEYYLLTLVDDRWWWWQTGGIPTPDTFSSWSALLTSLFSAVNVVPDITAPAAAYLTPNPVRWDLGIQPIPVVIEAVCRQNGLAVIRALDGTVSVVDFLTAYNADNARWTVIEELVLAGGRIAFADVGRAAPASVDVVYFDGDVQNTLLADVPISPGFEGYGGVEGVQDKIGRVTADPAAPTDTEKTAYTTAAVADYYNWFLFVTDCTLRAFYDGGPTGLEDVIEWVHHQLGLVTRIIRPPWSDRNVYGEAAPDATALGSAPEYKDECVNGYLVRKKATVSLTRDGLVQTEYVLDSSYGVPCVPTVSGSGGSGGDGPEPPIPDPNVSQPVNIAAVTGVCAVTPGCRVVTEDYNIKPEDFKVFVDATAGPVELKLPAWENGLFFIVAKIDDTGHAVTVSSDGTVNGVADVSTGVQWDGWTFDTLCDPETWYAR